MNIIQSFQEQVAARPDAAAVITTHRGRDRTITFGELDIASRQRAGELHESGLRPGDAVLILQPISIDLYVTLLAAFRRGLVAMFLDPSAGRAHVERCCALRPPDALVGTPKAHLLRLLSPALHRVRRKFVVGGWAPGATRLTPSPSYSGERAGVRGRAGESAPSRSAPHPSPLPCVQGRGDHSCQADTPALLTFTSGSTGQPKAAVRSHGLLAAQHRALHHALELSPGQVDLTTLPVFVLANLGSGVTSLIPDADLRRPGQIDPRGVVRQVLRHRPTTTVASPALLERLAAYGQTLPSFRRVFTGGAPVFPRTVDGLRAMSPDATIVSVYGSTEAEPIAHVGHDELSPADHAATLAGGGLLAGRPVPAVVLRIVPDRWGQAIGPFSIEAFDTQRLGANQTGEIVVTGDHVLKGYLDGRGDAETKFRVGDDVWHRTGDAGYLDHTGRLWLLGRCAARIDDRHGTLYPFAVEAAAGTDPAVARSAVVAADGERVLVVEPSDVGARDGYDDLKGRVSWARIASVLPMRIPVDVRHNAKVDYPALRKALARRR